MQTTFGFLCPSCPPTRPLAFVSLTRLLRAVPVSNTLVALTEKRVSRNIVHLDVGLDCREIPRVQGI